MALHFMVLGCQVEYNQAAKRLEQILDAQLGTPEAEERKLLIREFIKFEKDILKPYFTHSSN